MLLDVGGVLLLPDAEAPRLALEAVFGIRVPEAMLDRAHYCAIAAITQPLATASDALAAHYVDAYVASLDVPDPAHVGLRRAVEDAFRGGSSPWPRVVQGSIAGMRALKDRGIAIAIVSNSRGHVATSLRTLDVCQVGPGPGIRVDAIVDSFDVGVEKPDRRIFEIALGMVGTHPGEALHVGDSIAYDVRGAEAAGIGAVHFDPWTSCSDPGHAHVGSLVEVQDLL